VELILTNQNHLSIVPTPQAVTKYCISSPASGSTSSNPSASVINIRSAFIAPKGSVLISADYSQIELRVLAHMSQDAKLMHLLRQAGAKGDAFSLIAASFLGIKRTGKSVDRSVSSNLLGLNSP
jgi:hypothetical protein